MEMTGVVEKIKPLTVKKPGKAFGKQFRIIKINGTEYSCWKSDLKMDEGQTVTVLLETKGAWTNIVDLKAAPTAPAPSMKKPSGDPITQFNCPNCGHDLQVFGLVPDEVFEEPTE